jgi:hypothetical protein
MCFGYWPRSSVYSLIRCKFTWIAAPTLTVWAAQWAWTARTVRQVVCVVNRTWIIHPTTDYSSIPSRFDCSVRCRCWAIIHATPRMPVYLWSRKTFCLTHGMWFSVSVVARSGSVLTFLVCVYVLICPGRSWCDRILHSVINFITEWRYTVTAVESSKCQIHPLWTCLRKMSSLMFVHRWFGIASKFCKIFTYTSSSGKVIFFY